MYKGKCSLLNDVARESSCLGVPCTCVLRINFWPLRRHDHSGVLIGVGGTRRFDWPARLLANDVSTITRVRREIDCTRAGVSSSLHSIAK